MIIDTHQHFWQYNPVKHSWIDDEMAAIRRDFMPQDLQPVYEEHDITGCIAVQADQTLEENTFLLNLASDYDFIKGVIGWVDFQSDAVQKDLNYYAEMPLMKGYRHVLQSEADNSFLLRKSFLNGISKLKNTGAVYEILVFSHQLPAVLEFVKLFPEQQFVIDHIAKPYIKAGYIDAWALLMKAIGSYENVSCKISGMVTEADYKIWKPIDLMPYMNVVLEAFGPNRIVYGSDWPVCLVAGSYAQVLSVAQAFSGQLSKDEQELFFYKNAQRIYTL
ncbi:amidohydrolase family protein [Leeuwenhoekiella palythoae]|uniref:L-fuconolactonase n=1 Tax=Leeuwenhoekiella palythoae TaxID=573501 RepID=A0A1M5ZRN1_9FLAO|nr:amidohydrolase family protein [Leeuwenhoekiella palythoae]RXG26825.1 L-fuconolactonase [Leeuwenhoekiella palythoae]SHI26874.1 L-fuconolactonase [Leeuwenhoekiella palythoae]